jgi:hypothetical protein
MPLASEKKLTSHAADHLPGGLYANPSFAKEAAAQLIGDATNDRVESIFGMLDR